MIHDRPYSRRSRNLLIVAAALSALTMAAGLCIGAAARRAPQTSAPTGSYEFAFSQVAMGASSGGSANYSVEDTIKAGTSGANVHGSGNYLVTNALDASAVTLPPSQAPAAARPRSWTRYE